MSQSGRLDLAREMDSPVALQDLYLASYPMLSRPFVADASGTDLSFLEKANKFCGESIFSSWRKGFGALLKHIGARETYSEQHAVFLDYMMFEIEGRARHRAFAATGGAWTVDLADLLLTPSDRAKADVAITYDYIFDTQKWMSRLSMSAIEALAADVFVLDLRTRSALEQYEARHTRFMVKMIEALRRGSDQSTHETTLLHAAATHLGAMRRFIAEESVTWTGLQSDLDQIDRQWARLDASTPAHSDPADRDVDRLIRAVA
jgi:hypothetical protein